MLEGYSVKLLLAGLASLLVGGHGVAPPWVPLDPALVASATSHSIVFKDGSACSATAIAPQTLLTAEHCLGSTLVKIDGTPARVVWTAVDGKDHALIGVDRKFGSSVTGFETPAKGVAVVMVGNPGGHAALFRAGHVAGNDEDSTLYDVRIFFGDSGSGLISPSGRIVGVVSKVLSMSDRGASLTFAVSYPLAFTDEQFALVK